MKITLKLVKTTERECIHCNNLINEKICISDERQSKNYPRVTPIYSHIKCETRYYKRNAEDTYKTIYERAYKELVKKHKELFVMEEL